MGLSSAPAYVPSSTPGRCRVSHRRGCSRDRPSSTTLVRYAGPGSGPVRRSTSRTCGLISSASTGGATSCGGRLKRSQRNCRRSSAPRARWRGRDLGPAAALCFDWLREPDPDAIASPPRAKRRCPAGHPYSRANTYVHLLTGGRACRACDRNRKRGQLAMNKSADEPHLPRTGP
jgi:hypothetical protein